MRRLALLGLLGVLAACRGDDTAGDGDADCDDWHEGDECCLEDSYCDGDTIFRCEIGPRGSTEWTSEECADQLARPADEVRCLLRPDNLAARCVPCDVHDGHNLCDDFIEPP